jgi:hypothetical protein
MVKGVIKDRKWSVLLFGAFIALGVHGCSDDSPGVFCVEDKDCPVGQYCGPDKRCIPKPDGGQGNDGGIPHDSGFDAGFDAGWDSGIDAGLDSGWDSGSDAGTDGGTDGGAKLHPFISTGGGGKVVSNSRHKLMLLVAPTGPSGTTSNGSNRLKLGPASGVGVSK